MTSSVPKILCPVLCFLLIFVDFKFLFKAWASDMSQSQPKPRRFHSFRPGPRAWWMALTGHIFSISSIRTPMGLFRKQCPQEINTPKVQTPAANIGRTKNNHYLTLYQLTPRKISATHGMIFR